MRSIEKKYGTISAMAFKWSFHDPSRSARMKRNSNRTMSVYIFQKWNSLDCWLASVQNLVKICWSCGSLSQRRPNEVFREATSLLSLWQQFIKDKHWRWYTVGTSTSSASIQAQNACHCSLSSASRTSLCARTPLLHDFPFNSIDAVWHPYTPDSISRSSMPLSWKIFPITERKFNAIWKPPVWITVFLNSSGRRHWISLA